MTNSLVRLSLLLLLGLIWSNLLIGQETAQLISDENITYRVFVPHNHSLRNGTPDTLLFNSSRPFIDDFSGNDTYPDSSKWFVPTSDTHVPVITHSLSISPPTKGAVTFDGAKRDGEAYNPGGLASGSADRLVSHYIDLSNHDASDDIRLSFFLEAKGNGEPPEATDSFYVYFRTTFPPPLDFQKVLAVGGGSDTVFTPFIIAVNKQEYFHTQFQIIFESVGSINGYLDHWHLDNVYMATNRSSGDTSFVDRSPTAILQSPISPYTAIPVQHFSAINNLMQPFEVSVSNLENNIVSTPINVEISDPIGGLSFSPPTQQSKTINTNAYGTSITSFSAFGQQNITSLSSIHLSVEIPGNHDLFPTNNTLEKTFRVDSIFAYDDGEADRSFGINRARGFAVEYNLPQPDSLTAVWISFVPTVNFNPVSNKVTYMKDESFRLVVYKDPHPDSLILQQIGGMKVDYGDKTDQFIRYALAKPLPVPQTFWVGIQQTDELPIGVGFDENYDTSSKTFWDSSGFWVNVGLQGSLMIRPEMYNTAVLPASNEEIFPFQTDIKMNPNPVTDRKVNIQIHTELNQYYYSARLMDMSGREVFTYRDQQLSFSNISLELPSGLNSGVYFWQHQIRTGTGEIINQTEKILIFN